MRAKERVTAVLRVARANALLLAVVVALGISPVLMAGCGSKSKNGASTKSSSKK